MNAGNAVGPGGTPRESAPDRSTRLSTDEFGMMRRYVEEQCGVSLGDDKAYLLETRLTELLGEQGCRTFHELYRKARADTGHALRDKIIDAITTRETYWFRDDMPFAILREVVLPALEAEFRAGRKARARFWSAGCATGQEPYSVAMTILEYYRGHGWPRPEQCEIVASDISGAALFVARAGRYSAIDMSRGLPEALRDRFFSRQGTVWCLSDSVKAMVQFFRLNLQEDFHQGGPYDVVLCRNVLIYFAEELKKRVLDGMHRALRSDGVLLLGAAESVSRYSGKFDFVKFGQSGMYYRARHGS